MQNSFMNQSSGSRRGRDTAPCLVSRREALQRLSSGVLLSLGLWPGALRADNETPAGSFRFVVINDTHCMTPECESYVKGVVARIKQDKPEFCLHVGDLTDKGESKYFESVKEIFGVLPGKMYPVIGNHDYLAQTDRQAYVEAFPQRLNYSFQHRGWQFIGLDTTEGLLYEKTTIPSATFQWLDDNVPSLNKKAPTVMFTHFPMGAGVMYRPGNADALLDRFREFNLQAVFNGHYHAFTERRAGDVVLTTNRCCSLKRGNHDGTKEKGYFACEAKDGRVSRAFVEYKPAAA
jgi:3',5'-cyclic AMP phosphodiesterase CpdA